MQLLCLYLQCSLELIFCNTTKKLSIFFCLCSCGIWGPLERHQAKALITEVFSWCFPMALLKQIRVPVSRYDAGVGKGRARTTQNSVIKMYQELSSSFKAQISHYLNFYVPHEPECQSLGLLGAHGCVFLAFT